MNKCPECECEEFKEEVKGTHLGLYCKACNRWIKWVKQNKSIKTKEEYKNEYLEKQEPTVKQIVFLRDIIKYSGEIKNRLHASNIISEYLNGGD